MTKTTHRLVNPGYGWLTTKDHVRNGDTITDGDGFDADVNQLGESWFVCIGGVAQATSLFSPYTRVLTLPAAKGRRAIYLDIAA